MTLVEWSTFATETLQDLIAIPSLSREEAAAADFLSARLSEISVQHRRFGNNILAVKSPLVPDSPTVWLCSHHDTVPVAAGWTLPPFGPSQADGRIYGLGSNDAGGALVSMMAAFLCWQPERPRFNLALALVAEEEISGQGGVSLLLASVPAPDMAIVGEPTQLQAAIAEKGLLVVDAECVGRAGHAARDEGVNALYLALEDIAWIRAFRDPEPSDWLGPLRMTVTQLTAGDKHNVVPDRALYTIDIRLTEAWPHARVEALLEQHLHAKLSVRSQRLRPSFLPVAHPLAQAVQAAGCELYGSPTLSDMALLPCPSVKLGPGDSARSHTPDEWIHASEIEAGIARYLEVLTQLNQRL